MNMQNSYLTSKPHYEILDGLRGVAAAMVVAFHLLEAHSGGNHLNQIINHGYLAVDFFFRATAGLTTDPMSIAMPIPPTFEATLSSFGRGRDLDAPAC